jgi:hypothetical protein
MTRQVFLEQAVFGYKNGHEALKWSFPGSSLEEPVPIQQSDRSSDLTGYLHEETRRDTWHSRGFPIDGFYVLMRTWHDLDGPRRGCVWTHALYIPIRIIHELGNYLYLGHLFRRPVRGDYKAYAEPLCVDWPPAKPDGIELPLGQRLAEGGEFTALTTWDRAKPLIWAGDETAEAFCAHAWRYHVLPEGRRDFAFHSGAANMCWNYKTPYNIVCMAPPWHLVQGNFYHERQYIRHPFWRRKLNPA